MEAWVFSHRKRLLLLFFVITALMLYSAIRARVDVSFTKKLPPRFARSFLRTRKNGARPYSRIRCPEDTLRSTELLAMAAEFARSQSRAARWR